MADSFPSDTDRKQGDRPQRKSNAPKKIKPTWFRILFSMAVLGVVLGIYGVLFAGGMLDIIKGQLGKLRESRITQAYYDYTSKGFQETTSLEEFREFLAIYKVLSDNKTFIYEGRSINDSIGKIKGVLISNELHEMNAEYQLVKEENAWKIQSIRLKEAAGDNEKDSVTLELANKVHEMLKTLQRDEILDAYYGFLSKDFQRETPFQVFQEYVETNAILTSFKNVDFKDRRIEDGTGYVDLVLSTDAGNFFLEYKLKRENGDWRVWSLRLVLPPEEAAKKVATDPDTLAIPVRELLDSILLDNIEKAYLNTAKEFQEATSLASFESFVHSYSALTRRDLTDIKSGLIENGVGKLRVNLHDEEGMTVMEFKLGHDEGQWKIWGVQVIESPERIENNPMQQENKKLDHQSLAEKLLYGEDLIVESEIPVKESVDIDVLHTDIKKIIIGDEVDADGTIKIPRIVIDTNTNLLFINVIIEDGVVDSLVTLFLNHVDSGTTAPPLSTKLKQDGNTIVSIAFAAPSEGWPEGNYLIKVTTTTGDEHIQGFQMREGERKFY